MQPLRSANAAVAFWQIHGSHSVCHERRKLCGRERAKKLLKKLDSKFALAIGVSADWGLVCQSSLRLLDTTMHDIAQAHKGIQAFKDVLRILFVEGCV